MLEMCTHKHMLSKDLLFIPNENMELQCILTLLFLP